ncbi:MAG: diacylglycerol kinase family protein [Planctomycetota bacterium]
MRYRFLMNPVAGRQHGGIPQLIAQVMQRMGVPQAAYAITPTDPAGLVSQAAAAFAEADAVVVAGGDGTLHAVLEGYLAANLTGRAVGLIPVGTGNDLFRHHRSFNAFRLDPVTRLAAMLAAPPVPHPLWRLGDLLIMNYFSIGYDAVVARGFGRWRAARARPAGGWRSYLQYGLIGLRHAWSAGAPEVRLATPGGDFRAGHTLIAVSITSYAGGARLVASPADALTVIPVHDLAAYAGLMATRWTGRTGRGTLVRGGILHHNGRGILQYDGETVDLAGLPLELPLRHIGTVPLLLG